MYPKCDMPVDLRNSPHSSVCWEGPLELFWLSPPTQITITLNHDIILLKYEYLQDGALQPSK